MAYDDALAERLRDRLRDADGVTEKKMFGGLAFLTYGNMTVGVHGDELIARIEPSDTGSALAESGVRPFAISGRTMRGEAVPSLTIWSLSTWACVSCCESGRSSAASKTLLSRSRQT